ncbi:hypothetical protein [Streptomyces sp. TLI_105]|nr:hypothetical protein [Streptomyces sp. TLI_105]
MEKSVENSRGEDFIAASGALRGLGYVSRTDSRARAGQLSGRSSG